MSKTVYKLEKPLFGWAKGELLIFDNDWDEWTRKRTGETYNYRGSIGEGEIAMLLTDIRGKQMTSIMSEMSPRESLEEKNL